MISELKALIEYYDKEKGIDRTKMVEALSQAVLAASKKSIGPARELRIDIDPDKGTIKAFAKLIAVEVVKNPFEELIIKTAKRLKPGAEVGDEIEVEVTPQNMGRIAAQTAKQTMLQRLRVAEKENLYEEFKDRTGDVVSGDRCKGGGSNGSHSHEWASTQRSGGNKLESTITHRILDGSIRHVTHISQILRI